MRGPLAVVLSDGTTEYHVTPKVDGTRFKRTAQGGDVDLTGSVRVPRTLFRDLGPAGSVVVYDRRTGAEVWSGTPDNPGTSSSAAGQAFDLQAFGGAARLQAAKAALCYVDETTDQWVRSGNSTKRAETSQDEKGEDNPTLEMAATAGQAISTNWLAEWIYRELRSNGLKVGRLRADWDSGITNSGYTLSLRTGTDNDHLSVRDSATADTGGGTLRATLDGSIATGDTVASIRVTRTGGNLTGVQAHWFRFSNVTIRQVLKDVTGANILTGYTDNTINASDAILDMLGRGMAPGADPAKARVQATTYEIDQLAFLDGITMGDAMQALLVFERDLFWTLYGDEFTAGLWDDTADPRYVIGHRDGGISLPGQEMTLCNRVSVTWTDRRKKDHTTVVTTTVPGLTYTRDAEPITLPPGTGSTGNAQRAGERALAITNNPPKAGTAVVRRKIRDLSTGFDVWPHEIRPGCIVMDQQSGDRFRLTETDYSDPDGAATLTLGEPVRTIDQFMSHLARKQRRRG